MAVKAMLEKSSKSLLRIITSKSMLERNRRCHTNYNGLFSICYRSNYRQQMHARYFSSTSWSLDVVCTGEYGTSNTLLLNTPGTGYLFNCSEMTQRCLKTNNLAHKFNIINNIFLTSMSYSNISGIPGYLLSTRFRESKDPFYIHGHPNNENVFRLLHLFTEIRVNEVMNTVWRPPELKEYKDQNINVEYVKLMSSNQQDCTKGNEFYAVAYIVKTLQNTPRSFLVLECPTEDYLESLLSSNQLQVLSTDPSCVPDIVVHMSPAHIITNTRYTEFMSRFGSHTQHLMMNGNSPCLYIKTQHEVQQILHRICPASFPAIQSHKEYPTPPTIPVGNVVQAFNGLRYYLNDKPYYSINDGLYIKRSIDVFLKRIISNKVKKQLNACTDDDGEYPEITFLGTSSGIVNNLRNPSGILVQTRPDEYMLLDCGEGTLSQLYQIYGNQTDMVLSKLKVVFLSHLHFDHYGGLHNIIAARSKAVGKENRQDKLAIIAPRTFVRWVDDYEKYFGELSSKIKLFAHEQLVFHIRYGTVNQQFQKLEHSLGFDKITPVSVIHTEMAHGVVLVHQDGWKLVYSGDCRPTQDLIDAGKGCDILIHESTYQNKYQDKAEKRLHCTVSDALNVATQMEAKMTILTHLTAYNMFQTKYDHNRRRYKHIISAYDLMKVKRSSRRRIPYIKKSIIQAFKG